MAHRLSGYARIIPIEIMADKMTYISNGPCSSSSRHVKNAEKEESLSRWQQPRKRTEKGRRTHTLIPSIKVWMQRTYSEINYDLTHFLIGHGEYHKQQYMFKLDSLPNYSSCDGIPRDPQHVFPRCP